MLALAPSYPLEFLASLLPASRWTAAEPGFISASAMNPGYDFSGFCLAPTGLLQKIRQRTMNRLFPTRAIRPIRRRATRPPPTNQRGVQNAATSSSIKRRTQHQGRGLTHKLPSHPTRWICQELTSRISVGACPTRSCDPRAGEALSPSSMGEPTMPPRHRADERRRPRAGPTSKGGKTIDDQGWARTRTNRGFARSKGADGRWLWEG